MEQHDRMTDPTDGFIDEYCEFGEDKKVKKNTIWEAYRNRTRSSVGRNTFHKYIEKLKGVGTVTIKGYGYFKGIGLRNGAE